MTRNRWINLFAIVAVGFAARGGLFWAAPSSAQVALDEEFAHEPSWKMPTSAEVRSQVLAWLDVQKPDAAVRKQVELLWPEIKTEDNAKPVETAKNSAANTKQTKPVTEVKNSSVKLDIEEPKAKDEKPAESKPTDASTKETKNPDAKPAENSAQPAADAAAKSADTKPAEAKSNTATAVLTQVAATIALVDPSYKQLVELCSKPHGITETPEFPQLADEKIPAFVRNNLRLLFGQWLAQERRFDEAMAQLKGLQPTDVVDPASLLFYQSVCEHWMLQKTEGLASINKLLEQRKTIPRRYEQVAQLMQDDLNELEDESLDHISRRMNDVTRRLDFAHAGKQVRGVEDGIIASLDKMIKDLEDKANNRNRNQNQNQQRQQRQPGQGQGRQPQDGEGDPDGEGQPGDPNGIRSAAPATESRIAHARGNGEVKNKNIGNQSGWGDLPAKEREEAMQQISKEFPSHYRDIIEQYFKKLASEEEEK